MPLTYTRTGATRPAREGALPPPRLRPAASTRPEPCIGRGTGTTLLTPGVPFSADVPLAATPSEDVPLAAVPLAAAPLAA